MSNGESQVGTIETRVPARLDRLPWSRFHWMIAELLSGVRAEQKQLEDVAEPLTAEGAESARPETAEPSPRAIAGRRAPGRRRPGPRPLSSVPLDSEVSIIENALHGTANRQELARRVGGCLPGSQLRRLSFADRDDGERMSLSPRCHAAIVATTEKHRRAARHRTDAHRAATLVK